MVHACMTGDVAIHTYCALTVCTDRREGQSSVA